MKRERTATTVKRTRTILTSIAISKPGRDPGPIGTFQVLEQAKTAESIGSSREQSQRRGDPASAVCRRCFEPGKPGGRQNGGLQASPLLRGLRTTLLSGVLLCIEVETFPRHHKQRRVVSVYSRPPGPVKDKVPRARARPQAPPMNIAACWRVTDPSQEGSPCRHRDLFSLSPCSSAVSASFPRATRNSRPKYSASGFSVPAARRTGTHASMPFGKDCVTAVTRRDEPSRSSIGGRRARCSVFPRSPPSSWPSSGRDR